MDEDWKITKFLTKYTLSKKARGLFFVYYSI